MTSRSEVIGTITPAEVDPMTRLGLLLRDGLPAEPNEKTMDLNEQGLVDGLENGVACTTGCNRPNEPEKPKPLYNGVVPYPPPVEWQGAMDVARLKPSEIMADRRDYEVKADLEPIEFLLEYRRLIAVRLAPLSAMHRHAGKWDELRKAIRSQIKVEMRKNPAKFGMSSTSDAAFEDFANADPRYLAAIRVAFREAKEYGELSEELATLEHRIEARKVANMQFIKEMGLQ